LSIVPLQITGGGFGAQSADYATGWHTVSKATLVETIDATLTAGELVLPDDVPGIDVLRQELGWFRMTRSPITGQPQWGASAGQHDDAVVAASEAIWWMRASRGNGVSQQLWGV
jgi:hypothetical protein